MHKGHISLIVTLLILAALVACLGWLIYASVRQDRLNRALIAAIKKNDTKTALVLLAQGADPNARDMPLQHLSLWRLILDRLRGKRPAPTNALTALWLTCAWGEDEFAPVHDNWPMVKALLEHGAQVNVKDERGTTPLLLAAMLNKTKVGQLLIEREANVNIPDRDGDTPLVEAANSHNTALVRLLVDKGADVNVGHLFLVDSNSVIGSGWTPLMTALDSHEDDPFIIDFKQEVHESIQQSKGVRVQNEGHAHVVYASDNPALLHAFKLNRRRVVGILLQHGANVNFRASDGDTPLKVAREAGDQKLVQMLKQAGAKE